MVLSELRKKAQEMNLFNWALGGRPFPKNLWLYMDHLHSLNVAGTWEVGDQDPIID